MDEKDLLKELNKVLTLEHGHFGMYKNFIDYEDKELQRSFRRFTEIEAEHIEKLKNILKNLGKSSSLLVESGDIIGRMLGISLINITDEKELIKTYSFIEKKSYEGYSNFVAKLEKSNNNLDRYIAEIIVSNMLESQLMYLWLENKLTAIHP